MQLFKTIAEYCMAINIDPPKHPHFDIRRFEDNMETVVHRIEPFRHEFYAIALKVEGEGKAITGHNNQFPEGPTIFFNSPFQITSWDIAPDWTGFYIILTQNFIAQSKHLKGILEHFSFLKIDKAIPFEIEQQDIASIHSIYNAMLSEYQSDTKDKFALIESYVLLLLNYVKRYFNKNVSHSFADKEIRKTDLKLLARFQTMIETSFLPNAKIETFSNLHSPSHYAAKLNIHPNHLNAVVKEITGNTAKQHIQNHILQLAKSRLMHTQESVKEIAYSLYFDSPNNFNSFFKKQTSKTPSTYRKEVIL